MPFIYKKKQGLWLRWGSFISAFLLFTYGSYRLFSSCFPSPDNPKYDWLFTTLTDFTIPVVDIEVFINYQLIISVAVWAVVVLVSFFLSFSHKKLSEFLIDTESEMRKVSWPTTNEVVSSSVVVIITIFALGLYFYGSDKLLGKIFEILF